MGVGAVAVTPFDTTQITSPKNYSHTKAGDPCHPLSASAHPPAVAFKASHYTRAGASGAPAEVTPPLSADADKGDQDTLVLVDLRNLALCGDVAPTLDTSRPSRGGGVGAMSRACGSVVRRLTPRECERLQGFPDDHTLIPYRGKPAADGNRYKALGNSMAVPVMRWIGERLQQEDNRPGQMKSSSWRGGA